MSDSLELSSHDLSAWFLLLTSLHDRLKDKPGEISFHDKQALMGVIGILKALIRGLPIEVTLEDDDGDDEEEDDDY